MNLNIFKKYVSLCGVLSIKPSWKGLNEYYNHNRLKNSFTRKTYLPHTIDYKFIRN